MLRTSTNLFEILNGASQNGAGKAVDVSNYNILTLTLATENLADCTVTILGSTKETQPDWNALPTNDNDFTPIGFYDYDGGSVTPGSTGYVFAGADSVLNLNVQALGLKWINVIVSAYVAGNVYARLRSFTNL